MLGEFKAYVNSIFDFCVAIDSCMESSNIILNALDVTRFRIVHKKTADIYVTSPNFATWRVHHKEYFHKYKETEDVKMQQDYIRHPENYKEYQFTDEENETIEKIVTNPDHWLFPFIKEAGELKAYNEEHRIYELS